MKQRRNVEIYTKHVAIVEQLVVFASHPQGNGHHASHQEPSTLHNDNGKVVIVDLKKLARHGKAREDDEPKLFFGRLGQHLAAYIRGRDLQISDSENVVCQRLVHDPLDHPQHHVRRDHRPN